MNASTVLPTLLSATEAFPAKAPSAPLTAIESIVAFETASRSTSASSESTAELSM